MQRAKLCLAAACILAASTTRLSAQGFNGVIQFVSYEEHQDSPDTMTQITKGSKIRFEGMGKQGGAMIMDGDKRIILIPEQKKWVTMPADFGGKEARDESIKHRGTAVKTGKIENIAGIPCEDWHYKGTKDDGTPEEGDACIAKGAGMMVNRLSGGMVGAMFSAGGQGLADAMKNGGGIMKITDKGKVAFIAVKAQATSVPDAMFLPPADYTEMTMPGAGGRPHKP
jgi:uncharacterized protein DUF4412